MSFRGWLIKMLGGQEQQRVSALGPHVEIAAFAAPADPAEEAAGLNFRTAIETHQKWKARLKAVIDSNSTEALSVETLSRDDQCVLGKWIHGAGGQRFGNMPDFARLKNNHAHFHRCAGQVLGMAHGGKTKEAAYALSHGDYARVSQEVIMDLANMYTTVKK